jgi:hypothetical protein
MKPEEDKKQRGRDQTQISRNKVPTSNQINQSTKFIAILRKQDSPFGVS